MGVTPTSKLVYRAHDFVQYVRSIKSIQRIQMEYEKPITVKELIEKLKEFPEDMNVLVDGYEGGLEYLIPRQSVAYYNPTAWCGTFEEEWVKGESEDSFDVLVLSRTVE